MEDGTDGRTARWAVFRWQGMYLRTPEPVRPDGPVQFLEGGSWAETDLVGAGLEAIDAERLSDEEVRRLGLPDVLPDR